MLTDLVTRVVHIISYLLGSLFYLAQLQGDKTKYCLYSAVIWSPLTLVTKTISNCSRVFGCIVGFANPAGAIAIWFTAEAIDDFILQQKMAYTPQVVNIDANQTEIQGNAVFYFGTQNAHIFARRRKDEPLILKLQARQNPLKFVDLPDASPPSMPEVFSEYEKWRIRNQMAWFLEFLYQKHPQELAAAISSIPSESKLRLEMKILKYYLPDLQHLSCAPYQRGFFGNYVFTIEAMIEVYLYLLRNFCAFDNVVYNRHSREIWMIIRPTLAKELS